MAHAHATYMPSRLGTAASRSRRHAQVVKRRRMLLLGVTAFVLVLGVLANYGPLHSYFDARARLHKANASIAQLTAEKAQLQTQLGRLSEADYLESLARQDLSYTRPGEQLYIVTGADSGSTPASGASSGGTAQSSGEGFLERVLAPLLGEP